MSVYGGSSASGKQKKPKKNKAPVVPPHLVGKSAATEKGESRAAARGSSASGSTAKPPRTYSPTSSPTKAPPRYDPPKVGGATTYESSTASTPKSRRILAKEQAQRYIKIETAKLLDDYVEKDEKGKPQFEKEKVPAIKTSQKAIDRDLARFDEKSDRIAQSAKSPQQARRRIKSAHERLISQNFKTTKSGKIKKETVRVPVFKPRADPKQGSDLLGLNVPPRLRVSDRDTEAVVAGQVKAIKDEADKIRKTWKPGDPALGKPKKEIQKYFQEKYEKENQPSGFEKALHGVMSNTAKSAGINVGPLVPQVVPPQEIGTGVNYLLDWLTRPGAAVQTASAKAMVKAGLIKGDNARRIERAPNPLEALQRGYSDPKVVSGGDVTEGLFGVREAGIVSDILHDPLMYVGAGALRKGAAESVQALGRLERINKFSAVSLSKPKAKRLVLQAERTGDYAELNSYLKAVEKNALTTSQKVRTSVKRRGKRALNDRRAQLNEELLKDIRSTLSNAPTVGGKKYALPGELVAESARQVARHGVASRSIRPGARIRVMTPLGRELGSIPLPVPKALENLRILPTGLGRKASARDTAFRAGALRSERLDEVARAREDLQDQLAQAMRAKQKVVAQDLNHQLAQLDDLEKRILQDTQQEAQSLEKSIFESPRELAERTSSNRLVRESFRTSGHFARQFEQETQQALARILRKVQDDPDKLATIQMYRMAKQGTGDGEWFRRTVRALDPDEAKAVAELEKLDRAIAQHGQSLGTLNSKIENYVTRIYHESGDPFGTIDPDDLAASFPALGRTSGAQPYFGRHRRQPEMASIANPNMLAKALERISRGSLRGVKAREAADQLHRLGKIRGTTERLVRQVQRGRALDFDDLTDLEQQSFRWAEHLGQADEAVPIFKDLDATEGRIALTEAAEKEYGYNLDPFAGVAGDELRVAQLKSATLDRDALDEAIVNTSGKTKKQYQIMRDRVDEEIKALRAPEREGVHKFKPVKQRIEQEPLAWTKAGKAGRYKSDDGSMMILKTKKGWVVAKVKGRKVIGEPYKTLKAAKEGAESARPVRNRVVRHESDSIRVKKTKKGYALYDKTTGKRLEAGKYYKNAKDAKAAAAEHVKLDAPDFTDAPTHYGAGGHDPMDYTARLNDVRAGEYPGDMNPNLFPVLDPRVSTFWRTRVEGVQSALHARWTGLDEAAGRSLVEAQGKVYYTASGKTGRVNDLIPQRATDGSLMGYKKRGSDKLIKPDQIDIPKGTMIPNRDNTIFWDPVTGQEFIRPASAKTLGPMGRAIQEIIGDDRLWPAAMVQDVKGEMLRQGETAYRQLYETGMEHLFGRTLSLFRFGVTAPFPAFHIRNMVSDALKSLQADSGVIFHPLMNAQLTKQAVLRTGKGTIKLKGFPKELTMAEFTFMLDLFGVRSTQHLAEYLRIASTGKTVGKNRRRFSPGPEGWFGQRLIELGARREDIMRFMTFAQRMRRNKGDVADAAWYMTKHHFDYADLTMFERTWMRNIFLFYTWYRKNIPLQFAEIIARPGFFSATANSLMALSEGETPLNLDWSQVHPALPDMSGAVPQKGVIPDYMLTQLGAATTNWNGHTAAFAIGAPWVDMNLVSNFLTDWRTTLRQWFTMANPAITITMQEIFKVEPLTGRDYKEQEPTNALVAKIADLAGIELMKDEDGVPTVPWALNVVLRNIPLFGRGSSYFSTNKSLQDTGRLGSHKTWIQALGINPYIGPPEDRMDAYWSNQIGQRVGERLQLSFGLSNLKPEDREKYLGTSEDNLRAKRAGEPLPEFDQETLEWAKEHNIPFKALKKVQQSGFYASKDKGKPPQIRNSTLEDLDDGDLGEGGTFTPNDPPKQIPGGSILDDLFGSSGTGFGGQVAQTVQKAAALGMALGGKEGKQMMTVLAKNLADEDVDNAKAKAQGKPSPKIKKAVKAAATLARGTDKTGEPDAETLALLSIKYGNMYNVPPSVLFAQQGIESGWGNDTVGPMTDYGRAKGWTQFIDSTRDMVLEEHGVDAHGSIEESVHAQAIHLSKDLGYGTSRTPEEAIYGYNHSEEYVADVLGNSKAYRMLDKVSGNLGKLPKGSAGPKKFKGPWEGAQRAVLKHVPKGVRFEAKDDKRTPAENASVDGSETSMHLTTRPNTYAGDIPGTIDDGKTDKVAQKIAKDLGMASHHGTNEVVKDGYRYQLIWQDDGHYDHIHLGAEWLGSDVSDSAPGYSYGGGPVAPSYAGGGSAAPVGSQGGPGAPKSVFDKRVQQYLRGYQAERAQRPPYDLLGDIPEYGLSYEGESPGSDIAAETLAALERAGAL